MLCQQPTGFVDAAQPNAVCLLDKSLYGLRQAPRAWFNRFADFVIKLGFSATRSAAGFFLSQQRYAEDILERAGMTSCKLVSTPIDSKGKLSSNGPAIDDPKTYRSLAGVLQYLTVTRPELAFAVQQACLHMHDPRTPHLMLLKRILRYVHGTMSLRLHFCASAELTVTAYSDADWAGCPDTRRSTSAFCVFLGDSLIS